MFRRAKKCPVINTITSSISYSPLCWMHNDGSGFLHVLVDDNKATAAIQLGHLDDVVAAVGPVDVTWGGEVYLFIYLLKAYTSPVNRTGLPQGFSLNLILHRSLIYNTKQAHFYKRTTYKHNPKVSPFGIALTNNGK